MLTAVLKMTFTNPTRFLRGIVTPVVAITLALMHLCAEPAFCDSKPLEATIKLQDLLTILENPSAATELTVGVSGKYTHFTVNRVSVIPESAAFYDQLPASPPTAPATHFRGSAPSGAALGFTLFLEDKARDLTVTGALVIDEQSYLFSGTTGLDGDTVLLDLAEIRLAPRHLGRAA